MTAFDFPVGSCYKYNLFYPDANTGGFSGRWRYVRVTSVENGLKCFEFNLRYDAVIEIDPQAEYDPGYLAELTPIPLTEFETAWHKHVLSRLFSVEMQPVWDGMKLSKVVLPAS